MHEQINAYLKRHFGVDDAGAERSAPFLAALRHTLRA